MTIVRRILKCRPASINIMRTQPLCNIKLIERSTKSKKDPNPLSTTLSLMGQKYPISLDKHRAKQFGIPLDFFPPRASQGRADTRDHSRILCKKEAIDWWVSRSPLPSQDAMKVINILFKQPRLEAQSFYNIEFKTVRLGPVNVERKTIQTRNPLINAEKTTREQIIEQLFFP